MKKNIGRVVGSVIAAFLSGVAYELGSRAGRTEAVENLTRAAIGKTRGAAGAGGAGLDDLIRDRD
jgi:hypothetical protein